MAAFGGTFESSESIESKRESKRKEREEVLRKAKEKFEKEERRKDLKRARGEGTWMLPDVDLKLQQLEQEHKQKKKKSKKDKKKKAKKEKRKVEDVSSGSSEGSEEEWVESRPVVEVTTKPWKIGGESRPEVAPEEVAEAELKQRDEWMTFDFLSMRTTSVVEKRAEKEREKEADRERSQMLEQAGLHKLELNPYWKDGGCGLPPEDIAAPAHKAAVVDDGGLSWLRGSYQRMKEQAERESRSLAQVVSERYGSLEKFQKRLEEAEKVAKAQRRGPGRDRNEGSGWKRPGTTDDSSDREQESDRGRGGERSHLEGRGSRRDRDRHGDRDRDRGRGHPDQDGDRNRYRDWQSRRDRGGRADESGHRATEDPLLRRESPRPAEDRARLLPSSSSLKARFLKPTEDEPGPAWAGSHQGTSGFLKPRSEGTHEGTRPAWRKLGPTGEDGAGRAAGKTVSEIPESERRSPEGHGGKDEGSPSRATESESGEEEEEVEEEELILTDEEMNKLGAKLLKAELMGNKELQERLTSQLEAARRTKEKRAEGGGKQVSRRVEEDQEVVLYRTDQMGRAWPVKGPSEPQEPRGGRRKKTAIETHRDGERVRYFQDDDGIDLQEMVRREKMSTAGDQNALYSRMAAKMMGKQDGDNYTLDDMFVSSAAQRERSGRDEQRQRDRAVREHHRMAGAMDKCPHCFDSAQLPKHLVVAIGTKVYLSLPNAVSLTEGHCLICPLQHHTASTALDEDVWAEVQIFRKALVKMFQEQHLDCVFLETHMNPKRRLHMVYECVPLPRELGDMAPIYFKKAILESDEEWAMNKKLVDLSSRDVRHAVPKGLPFFSVDFGLQGGFAHVIENEQKFPHYFGKEILGGMLDLEPRRWRKPMRENFDDQRKKVLQFAQRWKPFDCTKTD
ncbi:CWF19-like protein 2 [Brienomyrus brachyistius]|uniref:CWF19-like protein 2 n=1 Tax=Brienomyrus brachyistius TaxID=42636 RepID=UPI0020B3A6CA|nr:CWF19-like protein 2 [Brienomyrus brachyistius]